VKTRTPAAAIGAAAVALLAVLCCAGPLLIAGLGAGTVLIFSRSAWLAIGSVVAFILATVIWLRLRRTRGATRL
jgi:hypothetical protein